MPVSKNPNQYEFSVKVWLWTGDTPWHFVSLPKPDSEEIKTLFGEMKRGWGSLPVQVTIGKTSWKTSIFPDKKSGQYLLPLKAQARKAENISAGGTISLTIEVKVYN